MKLFRLHTKLLLGLMLWLLAFATVGYTQNTELFERANNHYNEGEFERAISDYEAIIESGEHSAELYFNLANAYYKTHSIAPSIYYYEKALLLQPNDKDILNNLGFAQKMTIDEISESPQVGFGKLYHNLLNTLSFDAWAKWAITSVICFVLFFLLYYFANNTYVKRVTFVGSFVAAFLALGILFIAFQKFEIDHKYEQAIVFAQAVDVKNEPNAKSNSVFKLHEGTKVKVIDNLAGWSLIEIADGLKGWIPSAEIKAL